MIAKPKVINFYAVLKDEDAAKNMKKQEFFYPFGVNYKDEEWILAQHIGMSMNEIHEEANELMSKPNWNKDEDMPKNTYCINNATDTEQGWMTGAFVIWHVTPEHLAIIKDNLVKADEFFNWVESKTKEKINLFKTTGFTYIGLDGLEHTALIAKNMTLTTPKTVMKPDKAKAGEYWRKITVDATVTAP